MKLVFIVLFWLLTFIVLSSCICVENPVYITDAEYDRTSVIARAKVVYQKFNDAGDSATTVLRINENYTPDYALPVLKLNIPIDEKVCGVEFEEGQEWLVFAYKKDSVYTTSACTRTMRFIPQKDYKLYNDRYIDIYHKNLLYLKSKMK